MSNDVFISYAKEDKKIADAVCAKLENSGIRCWIAPRDNLPGPDYAEGILHAIENCKILILVFSSNANTSYHIKREVERAVSKGKIIIPFRVENVLPSASLEYFISASHWLDAMTPPLEKHINSLATTVKRLLNNKVVKNVKRNQVVKNDKLKKWGVRIGIVSFLAGLIVLGIFYTLNQFEQPDGPKPIISINQKEETQPLFKPETAPGNGYIECGGPTLLGNIQTAGSFNIFKFNAKAGDAVAIAIAKAENNQSALFTPCWQLFDPSGKRVNGWVKNRNKTRKLPSNGIFTIKVWDDNHDSIGEYYIRLEPVSASFNGEQSKANPISCSQKPLKGYIPFENAINSYKFSGKAGEAVSIAIAKTEDNHSALFNPCWRLLNPSGNPVEGWVKNANRPRKLPVSGIYTIRVWDDGFDGTGNFYLRLEPVSASLNGNPSCAKPIYIGADPQTGTISFKNAINSHKFKGKSGQIVTISVFKSETNHSALFTPCWILLDASGKNVHGWVKNGSKNRTLKDNAFYTIRVWDDNNDGLGKYRISLN